MKCHGAKPGPSDIARMTERAAEVETVAHRLCDDRARARVAKHARTPARRLCHFPAMKLCKRIGPSIASRQFAALRSACHAANVLRLPASVTSKSAGVQ